MREVEPRTVDLLGIHSTNRAETQDHAVLPKQQTIEKVVVTVSFQMLGVVALLSMKTGW